MELQGFEVVEKRQLSEVGGTVTLYVHKKTKAELLSVVNDDENKCFGVSFRTPATNSTGVAHIMEHSVLCGSAKYPVKEPFVELLKGSLQTFLNAFTFPDKTCYPVASANLKDFYNLIQVYLDAVFHPRISEDIFRQEGWHLEAQSGDAPWSYKGVVFNEMKGAYSSPDSFLNEKSQHSLFPDTIYSFDSGGDPEKIPSLSYADFLAFHQKYYHPSNARFFFWGNDPEAERFKILAEVLANYNYQEVDSFIQLQQPWDTPRKLEYPYAAGSAEQKAMFTVNWLLGEQKDLQQVLALEMLDHILVGMPGSPLERALISSGLGEDTCGCGFESNLRQNFYSVGLRGIKEQDVTRAETLIFDTLQGLVSAGLPQNTVEAAVNTVEFAYREANSGKFPRGLVAMIQALAAWNYDRDPIAALAWEEPLSELKQRLAHGERCFENLIEKYFLTNQHRSTVVLLPDLELLAKREAKEAEHVAALKASMDEAKRQQIVRETEELAKAQLTPDSAEALATIPRLYVSDLPKENKIVPVTRPSLGFDCVNYEQPTVGVAYTSLLLPLKNLPNRLLPLLHLFNRTVTEVGTKKRNYVDLGEAIAGKTGGISAGLAVGTTLDQGEFYRYFTLIGKAVYDKIDDLFALYHEVLLEPLLDRSVLKQRLGQMLLEAKARLEEGLQSAGHLAVSARLAAHYSVMGAFEELTTGYCYLESLRALVERFQKDPDSVLDDLETLRAVLLGQEGAIFCAVAEEAGLAKANALGKGLLQTLPTHSLATNEDCTLTALKDLPRAEGLLTQSRINYVGQAVNLYQQGWTYHGSASVVLRFLSMGYLWENVRVRGGAYGAFCSFDRSQGTFRCVSYRDPNVSETLKVYAELADFLQSFSPEQSQLSQAIIGAIGDLDTYQLPSNKAAVAFARLLAHDTDERRQSMREEMFATKASDFNAFGQALASFANGEICVLGGSDVANVAKENDWPLTKVI